MQEATATTALRPWGNSMAVRIPKTILEHTSFTENDNLTISVEDNMIIIKKEFKHKTFEERLAEYDGKLDKYPPFDWGEPAGRELL